MSVETAISAEHDVEYPESDGLPIADNTLQFRWIVTIQGGLDAMFRDNPNVFVAGDFFWYPIQGRPDVRVAPDAMVVFGHPKGDRGSYRQWDEDGIAPKVVFEVLSPGNRPGEMILKFQFYERYGVEEYYMYDPDSFELDGWIRQDGHLKPVEHLDGWVSPSLGIRFQFDESGELKIYRPDGTPFATYVELAERAERESERERERERAERLAARLKELGIDPDAPQ